MAGFFNSVWNYLYEAYIKTDNTLGGQDSLVTVGMVVLGLFIGSIIACVVMMYNRKLLGTVVRKILAQEITTRQSAKTIEELGYKKNVFIRGFFRDSESLRRVVKCVEEEDFYAEQKSEKEELDEERAKNKKLPKFKEQIYRVDVDTDHFYIPEDLRDVAEKRFNKKGSGWGSLILATLALTAIFIALLFALPWLFSMISA